MKWTKGSLLGLILLAVTSVFAMEDGPTLAAIKARGHLKCGTFGSIPGFSLPDSRGVMRGIEADACRAVAAAVLGDPGKVKFVLLTAQQRLPALQAGEVDILQANLTWTFSREARAGLSFASIYYYDGQTFIVKKELGVSRATELDGASICFTQGSSTELTVQQYFAKNKLSYTPVVFADVAKARKAFLADRCDTMAGDGSSLAGFKASRGAAGVELVILPDRISKEPYGGAVRKGDSQWFDIVRWTHFALINAEALGITSKNIDAFKNHTDANVRRFLGDEGTFGESLGLSSKWAYRAIKTVGNFAEIWDRNIVNVERGMNRIWTEGGLQYSPPFR